MKRAGLKTEVFFVSRGFWLYASFTMPLNYVCFLFRVSKYLQSPKYFARYCARLQGTTVNKQLPALMGFHQVGREANK